MLPLSCKMQRSYMCTSMVVYECGEEQDVRGLGEERVMRRGRSRFVSSRQEQQLVRSGEAGMRSVHGTKRVLVVGYRKPGDRRHSWWTDRTGTPTPADKGKEGSGMTWGSFATFLWGCAVVLTDPLRRVFK